MFPKLILSLLLFGIFSLLVAARTLKSVPSTSEERRYRPFFKNGRVLGGMVGHWKEDFSRGQSETESAESGLPGNPNVTIQWFNQKLDHFN